MTETFSPAIDLVTLEELKQLKYRYLRYVDSKDWDGLAGTLTPDVSAHYGERLSFEGRDDVISYFTQNVTAGIITVHHCHHPELQVHGSEATGRWSLDDTVIVPEFRFLLKGAAQYTDRYRRGADGAWRIAATSYQRLYEATISLDDLPSFTLTTGQGPG